MTELVSLLCFQSDLKSSSIFIVFLKGFSNNENQEVKDFFGRTPDGLYLCKVCGKTEKFHTNMKNHIEYHHYSPGYSCALCGKTWKVERHVRKHFATCSKIYQENIQ